MPHGGREKRERREERHEERREERRDDRRDFGGGGGGGFEHERRKERRREERDDLEFGGGFEHEMRRENRELDRDINREMNREIRQDIQREERREDRQLERELDREIEREIETEMMIDNAIAIDYQPSNSYQRKQAQWYQKGKTQRIVTVVDGKEHVEHHHNGGLPFCCWLLLCCGCCCICGCGDSDDDDDDHDHHNRHVNDETQLLKTRARQAPIVVIEPPISTSQSQNVYTQQRQPQLQPVANTYPSMYQATGVSAPVMSGGGYNNGNMMGNAPPPTIPTVPPSYNPNAYDFKPNINRSNM